MQSILVNSLPQEIVAHIYEYTGYKLRNGIYMRQLDKKMEIFKLLLDIPIISNGEVELFIKGFKRKWYCEKKFKIKYENETNQYYLKVSVDEHDWDDSFYEVDVYDEYWY